MLRSSNAQDDSARALGRRRLDRAHVGVDLGGVGGRPINHLDVGLEVDDGPEPATTHRSVYRPWAELLKRSFAIDVLTCARCGGRAKLIALVTKPASIARFLRHLGEPTEVPALSSARGPPFWKSRALRRKAAGTSPAQAELFDA